MLLDASVKERRTALENFMKFLAKTPKLASSSILLQFLGEHHVSKTFVLFDQLSQGA